MNHEVRPQEDLALLTMGWIEEGRFKAIEGIHCETDVGQSRRLPTSKSAAGFML